MDQASGQSSPHRISTAASCCRRQLPKSQHPSFFQDITGFKTFAMIFFQETLLRLLRKSWYVRSAPGSLPPPANPESKSNTSKTALSYLPSIIHGHAQKYNASCISCYCGDAPPSDRADRMLCVLRAQNWLPALLTKIFCLKNSSDHHLLEELLSRSHQMRVPSA